MKLRILIILFVLGLAQTVFAGDFARRDIIGFSKDGGLFAFEEYGIQDGSGFAYSNIYIIDIKTDKWVSGSPFRVLNKDVEEENYDEVALRSKARKESRMLAKSALSSITQPGLIVATNRPTEKTTTPGRMEFQPRMIVPPIDTTLTVILDTYPLNGGSNCEGLGEIKGFKLTRLAGGTRSTDLVMHKDAKIPKSRSCPLEYSLADVITYHPHQGNPVMAVLILMRRFGFEGPDGRYLAITGPLN